MSQDCFVVERRGSVCIFRINRPDQSNALSRKVLIGIGQFARDAGSDPRVRALVITGAGPKVFCAGADLKERAGWSDDDVRDQLRLYRSELGALDHCPKPVVAAINGHALGGGLEIAMTCDLRVAASHALFAQPEVSLGIIPGAGGTQRLTRLVGEGRAKELVLLGRRIPATEALAIGLINRICPESADVLEDTLAWIEPITKGAPIAHCAALSAIDAAVDACLEQGLNVEQLRYEDVLRSDDRKEGILAFAERRAPQFTGK